LAHRLLEILGRAQQKVGPMKSSYPVTITSNQKSKKKQKKAEKTLASASIAQRYMELRRLRERIAEVEMWRNAR
jgi:hypothetical protein